ncbi:MAG: peptidase M22, partial [Clostridia bacterium]|nr:peptidase M22 [Clostridia bacterium]
TTEVLLYDNKEITCIGGTKDISAGQLIDRIGVVLGLSFPCGKELEAICDFKAMKHEGLSSKISVSGLDTNLSGLENKANEYIRKGYSRGAVAAFVMTSIEKTLSTLTENAIHSYGKLPILFSGGVASNRYLQSSLKQKFNAYFAEPAFSSDNAAGIALLCEERYRNTYGN